MPDRHLIFNLTCEDASHLGGPMGGEYTTHVFTKPFNSIDAAQEFAVKYQGGFPEWAQWKYQRDGHLSCDSGAYIWSIRSQEVEA